MPTSRDKSRWAKVASKSNTVSLRRPGSQRVEGVERRRVARDQGDTALIDGRETSNRLVDPRDHSHNDILAPLGAEHRPRRRRQGVGLARLSDLLWVGACGHFPEEARRRGWAACLVHICTAPKGRKLALCKKFVGLDSHKGARCTAGLEPGNVPVLGNDRGAEPVICDGVVLLEDLDRGGLLDDDDPAGGTIPNQKSNWPQSIPR
jgi:hypothetical protein